MKRRYAAGAALALVLAAQTTTAEATPAHWDSAIAYVSDQDSTTHTIIDEVYLINPNTGQIQRLTYDLPGVERWPSISPDGRSLAWVRWPVLDGVPHPELSEIYRCDLRLRAGTWSCNNPRKVVGPVQQNAIAWTPDSRTILYSEPLTADSDADIYSVDVRTGLTRNLTHEAVADGTVVQDSQPTVSPNGRYFVYTRGSTGTSAADLYRRNIDGSNPVQLTAAPRNDVAADYSPDGKRLVFHSNRDGGDSDIYIMKAAVEGPDNPAVNLTDGLTGTDGQTVSQERAPSFSPDGHRIAFYGFTDNAAGFDDGEIYVMRTDGTRVRNLTHNNPTVSGALTIGDIQPDWGPSLSGHARHDEHDAHR